MSVRFAALVALALVVLTACSPPPPPTADQITAQLTTSIAEADQGVTLTPDTDPNRLLGRPGQYSSAASIVDQRIPSDRRGDPAGVDAGAKVEVFEDGDRAQTRAAYIGQIGQASPLGVEYDYVAGAVLLRVSGQLPPAVAEQYRAAFMSAVPS